MPGDRAAPDGDVAGWFRHRYAAAAPATWSRKLATPRSAATWWRAQGRLAADPTVLVERHRETPDRTRALTVAQVQGLWRREDVALWTRRCGGCCTRQPPAPPRSSASTAPVIS